MKSTLIKFKKLHCLIVAYCLFQAPATLADGTDGFTQVFSMFFGTEQTRTTSKTCDGSMSDSGVLSILNSFFCHMEKDMGITFSNVEVTKAFSNMKVHAKVDGSTGGAAYTVGGTTYDYQAQVWICLTSGSACTATNQFSRAIYIAFSYSTDRSINKGVLLMNPGAFQGNNNGIYLKYDVGTNTANKLINVKMLFTQNGSSMFMRADATKSSNVTKVNMVMKFGSNSMRFAGVVDETQNLGSVYFEAPSGMCSGTGCTTVNINSASDTPSVATNGICFSRSRTSTDWSYSSIAGSNCSSLSFAAFSADSATIVATYSTTATDGTGVLVPASGGSLYNGMAVNPSGL